MLHDFRNVILGRPGRDEEIENVQESIRVAGRVGIPIVEYNFYALRAMGGYYRTEGRGGSRLATHDYDRSKNLPVLSDIGEHSEEELWERYTYFLKAVVPVAEEAGVRLAVHPNDPPAPKFRGAAQILGSIDGLKRLVDIVPSPASGITFDTGVTREMGHDPVEIIRYFGKRDQINHVHFRNVITKVPRLKYTEVFIEEGQADMLAALRALREVRYSRLLYPDHVPQLPGDAGQRIGWAYAVGYIKALMRAA
jgi:mannonate dehydratase